MKSAAIALINADGVSSRRRQILVEALVVDRVAGVL